MGSARAMLWPMRCQWSPKASTPPRSSGNDSSRCIVISRSPGSRIDLHDRLHARRDKERLSKPDIDLATTSGRQNNVARKAPRLDDLLVADYEKRTPTEAANSAIRMRTYRSLRSPFHPDCRPQFSALVVSIAVHTNFPHISGTRICPLFTSGQRNELA